MEKVGPLKMGVNACINGDMIGDVVNQAKKMIR